ncbi:MULTISPECIES: hypothetical protein [Methylobacterium]|jgi:hypothetical protein|uniref:Uncharacterized protein n=1 Tax=Methylobacterium jeotgali TaxID=381630 RepID=A0ABQ4SYX1_9HYPH|nr:MULTISPECIES: hypothetical protein [Methylobacterium]GBU16827.1 hypothetical protein AwMethylo_10420 [Methylobacterium sp.]GJE08372.1 hypothetical protein AOPFMNJM_3709 [Methylobacterium jeotgali]
MAELRAAANVVGTVTFVVTEEEVRALDALVGYGDEAFLRVFYKQLGQSYLKPHEAGLRSLFKRVRADMPFIVRRFDAARAAFRSPDPDGVRHAVARIAETAVQRRQREG